jgi:hypothetical protein
MHVYSNISIHSVQKPNYIWFFFFSQKIVRHMAHIWPRGLSTRGHSATCNKYMWPHGRM